MKDIGAGGDMIGITEAAAWMSADTGRGVGARGDYAGVSCIVAGGQTGADRAAMEWAQENDIRLGGWCPQGRRAEDGTIPEHFDLQETPSHKYVQRTGWNVRDSDGTLIVTLGTRAGAGVKDTFESCRKYRKACLHISKTEPLQDCIRRVRTFLEEHGIRVLNVAGSRESEETGVGEFVKDLLSGVAADGSN